MQQCADVYLLLNYCTCFGRPSRPSSGVHKTVVAASGTVHTTWAASFLKRDLIRTYLVTFEEATDQTSPYLVTFEEATDQTSPYLVTFEEATD